MNGTSGLPTLSVVIPARNEAEGLRRVLAAITNRAESEGIPHEIVVVDDHSTDDTAAIVEETCSDVGSIRCVDNPTPPGLGNAIEFGLRRAEGEVVAIMMADGSDSPGDLVTYYRAIRNGADCAFGSRFIEGSCVEGYPPLKLVLNRAGNWLASLVVGCCYNDLTNAFKAYRASLIGGMLPLRSRGFDVTLELPIRAINANATYEVLPISWRGRTSGESEMTLFLDAWRYLRRLVLLRWQVPLGGRW